jgi:hypothetical protein
VQAYGTTWFTLFSPRIQHYTVGIEPAFPEWAAPPPPTDNDNETYAVVVNWLGKPDVFGVAGRATTPGLFRRAYEYTPNATGLKGVPIQVWATKSFAASWRASLRGAQPKPLFQSDVRYQFNQAGAPALRGTVTNNLPVELKDAVLLHQKVYYPLGDLRPGEATDITKAVAGGQGKHLDNWFRESWWNVDLPANPQYRRPKGITAHIPASSLMKTLLFHKADAANPIRNSFFRHLDQGWRLSEKHQDEVILVGRLAPKTAAAEKINGEGLSPTRLWLGQLPGGNREWQPPAGTLSQETYVRVFIPVIYQK